MRKAQIEIAGLLIVVVLVTITILFLLTFKVNESENKLPLEQESKDSYIRDRLSPVLLETSTSCDGRTIRVLLSDCAYSKNIMCDKEGREVDSCVFANETISTILEETLDTYGLKYVFSVKSNTDFITYIDRTGCNPAASGNYPPFIQPLVTDFGPLTLNLVQCR